MVVEYTRMIGGYGSEGFADAIYDERDKSIVFLGYTTDSCNTGDLPPCIAAKGKQDLLMVKVGSDRNIVWMRSYGGSGIDFPQAILNTKDGGYIVAAFTESINGDVIGNHGPFDYWILKLDKNGFVEWKQCYGNQFSQDQLNILQTKDKGYLITGCSNGSGGDVPFEYVPGQFGTDWFLIKVDSDGVKQWCQTLGGTETEHWSRVFEVDNGYYLAGGSESRDFNCNDTIWRKGLETYDDFVLIKLDTAGNYIWNKTYGGSKSDYFDDAIWDDRDSSFVLVGRTGSKDYFVPTEANGQGHGDLWVLKLDKDGIIKYNKRIGDNSWEIDSRVIKTKEKNGYVLTCKATPYAPIPSGYFTDNNGSNIHVFELDSALNVLTDKIIGGKTREIKAVALNAENNLVVVGETTSTKFEDGKSTANHGKTDIFISYLYSWGTVVKPQNKTQRRIIAYPNPTSNIITIEVPNSANGSLIIKNSEGKLVYSEKNVFSSTITLSTAEWSKGVYIISWSEFGNKPLIEKIVVR